MASFLEQQRPRLLDAAVWFDQVGAEFLRLAPTPKTKAMVHHKIVHTAQVVAVTGMLWPETDRGCSLEEALMGARMHDVGRLAQVVAGWAISDVRTGIDHALISEQMFRESGLPVGSYEMVAEAIGRHSAFEDTPTPASWLLRDADKAANLLEIERWFASLPSEPSRMHPLVVEALSAGRMVDNTNVETVSDQIGSAMGWLFGIHYPATRRLLMAYDVPDRLLGLLHQSLNGQRQTDFLNVYQAVERWKETALQER